MHDRTRRTLIAVLLVAGAGVGIGCQQAEPTLSLSDQAAAESARPREQAAVESVREAAAAWARFEAAFLETATTHAAAYKVSAAVETGAATIAEEGAAYAAVRAAKKKEDEAFRAFERWGVPPPEGAYDALIDAYDALIDAAALAPDSPESSSR
jgi:hypothetical protein